MAKGVGVGTNADADVCHNNGRRPRRRRVVRAAVRRSEERPSVRTAVKINASRMVPVVAVCFERR
jgi:hypothetical protein